MHYQARLLSFAARHAAMLVLAALWLLASWPLVASGAPTVGDGLNHFYRLAELDWHVRRGDLFPRWFANLHYGFGAPLLNFYAPLSYYLALLPRLFALPLPASLLLGFILAQGAALLGTYRWARDQWASPTSGLIAAAAYGLAPYLYLNLLHRGSYPELWGLALAPWLMWAARRLALELSRRSLFAFAVLSAALILTHTLSAFLMTPLAAAYFAGLVLASNKPRAAAAIGLWSVGFGLSAALAAFFVLPVIFESQYVQLFRTFLPADLDYRRNFLTLAALLSPPANFDPRLVFNEMPASIGWPQAALAAIAVLAAISRWRSALNHRSSLEILGIGLLGFGVCFFTLDVSSPLWAIFPFARFIQFPWRLLGPASLLVAALAGAGAEALVQWAARRRIRAAAAAIFVAAFFFFSLSWTYHADFAALPASVAPADTIRYEISSGHLGATSAGEYLPRWVSDLPPPDTLLRRYASAGLSSRLAPLPGGAACRGLRLALHSEEYACASADPFVAEFYAFYFPGWTASVDGRSAPIRVSTPNGLITVAVPAGEHIVRLSLRPTLPQIAGDLISLAAVFVAAWLIWPRRAVSVSAAEAPRLAPASTAASAALIVLLLIARVVYFDRFETFFHYTAINSLPQPSSVNFDNQLELIGAEHPPTAVSGGALDVILYWRALAPLARDYSTTVQLADRFGNRFGVSDSQHPGRVPTSRWLPEQYARDAHQLISLDGTPPGEYHLLVGVYESSAPLSILEDGAPIGTERDIGAVRIVRAQPQPPGPLRLADFDLAADSVTVGDQLAFTTGWDSGDAPADGLTARLSLADSSGQPIFSHDFPPAGADYPSSQWAANERIRYPQAVTLPPDLPAGPASVSLALIAPDGAVAAGPYLLGPITIVAPRRSFEIPAMRTRVNYDFGGSIRLLGYDVSDSAITLYWQSLQPVNARLTVFVHRLDANGAFAAGHDAPPRRPTTGWLPGEVIADVHPLAVGDHFEIGLYDPSTGERFGRPLVVTP